ncbi:TetR/AcrR family transcriptional regulator [Mechercharimyces sp. CAU 1602]|uniref:TetR/AcrR family transcriptional regulator n=1 Tax=Mechercharimyces sp. CAU 1602 TaxID=2973933 RepID=UPI00216306C5|nr:TetR/AcrR family transcriptional regulator [Mechercharimyces sp. CAU 1602]MCS1350536.1 TetR/AcrR family transcriptional regulator [Mechercharimyces sp. CAU 1602]
MSDWHDWVEAMATEYELDLDESKKLTDKQRRILESAICVFAERGFSGASTQLIAKEAGVAEATIFKHYKSKKGLLLRLVIPVISKVATPYIVHSLLDILQEDLPIQTMLEELYKDRIRLVKKNWEKVKVLLVESMFHPELREALEKHVIHSVYHVMSERIVQFQKEGKVRADIPVHIIVRSIMSLGMGYIVGSNVAPHFLACSSEKEEIKWMTKIILNGIEEPTPKNEKEGAD